MRSALAAAGFPNLSVAHLVMLCALTAAVAGAVVLALLPVVALAAAAALAGAWTPWAVVAYRARRSRNARSALWPEVVERLLSSIRAGLPLPDAIAALGDGGPVLLRSEFARFAEDYEATAQFSWSIDRLKHRLADPVADRLIETLRMAREVGSSDLVDVLRSLAGHLRQHTALRAEIEARQSWIVNAARVGAAAPWIVLVLLSTRPEAVTAYNSGGGLGLIAAGGAATVVAYQLMLRFARLPEEQRWQR
ncbi:type II secretion system F family protein [Ruicaihuangia caeni]|uniref:type II secretion system F family protein n=1 Tax=Ruicaihuangia caeni TaxID=3042517 RepID=UPI00338D9B45